MVLVFDRTHVKRIRREHPATRVPVILLGDYDPEWAGRRAILDPWGMSDHVFDETFARIDRCAEALLRALLEPERD